VNNHTLEEVEAIVGGKHNSFGYTENGAGEQTSTHYSFINKDGSNAIVHFKDGKVMAKDGKYTTELP
jgi:penicillin V acylase-like amidase (Ntn superfamily)